MCVSQASSEMVINEKVVYKSYLVMGNFSHSLLGMYFVCAVK